VQLRERESLSAPEARVTAEVRRRWLPAALLGVAVVGALAVWILRRGEVSPPIQTGAETSEVPAASQEDGQLSTGSMAVEPQLGEQRAEQLVEQTFMRADEVEPVAPERLMGFLPDSVKGLRRAEARSDLSAAAGLNTTVASARYLDDSREVIVTITDLGGPKGVAAFAAWALVADQHDAGPTGFETVYRKAGRVYYEAWYEEDSRGQASVVLRDRFAVDVSGTADSHAELAAVLDTVDLEGIEKLGVK
jgi:hypothetical protein